MEFPAVSAFIIQKGGFPAAAPASRFIPNRGIRCMKTDNINSHACKTVCQFIRCFMIRRIGSCCYIKSQKSGTCSIFKIEMPFPALHKSMLPRRCIKQIGIVQYSSVWLCLVNPDFLFHVSFPPFFYKFAPFTFIICAYHTAESFGILSCVR